MSAPASLSSRAALLESVRQKALACRACALWQDATQTVFGEGPVDARIVLVGEQPGDIEDREGHPFVGPAGRVLERALAIARIERSAVFATNAVKHFKFRARGTQRIHQRPAASEVAACRPWLQAEFDLLAPNVIVALGATAAQALLGRTVGIRANRGRLLQGAPLPAPVLVTAHPSSVLRERDGEARNAALAALADDLRIAASVA